jgi:hypothetical protein
VNDLVYAENALKFSKPGIAMACDICETGISNEAESEMIEALKESGFNVAENVEGLKAFDPCSRLYYQYSMSFPLNISGFLKIVEKSENEKNEISQNIKRLVKLNNLIEKYSLSLEDSEFLTKLESFYLLAEKNRGQYRLKYPVRLVVLVEGSTEEKLLPLFALKGGVDFAARGVEIIGAGGKNQVARVYNKFYKKLNIPILLILDADAESIAASFILSTKNWSRHSLVTDRLCCVEGYASLKNYSLKRAVSH